MKEVVQYSFHLLKKLLITSEVLSPITFTISDHDTPFTYSIALISSIK